MKKETTTMLAQITIAYATFIGAGLANVYYIKELSTITTYTAIITIILYILVIIAIIATAVKVVEDGL